MRNKITQPEFEDHIKRLKANLGKVIKKDDLDYIFDELGWIPREAWPDIVNAALDEWETWPRNFPKAIKTLWFAWQRDRQAHFEKEDCNRCQGEGLLRYEMRIEAHKYYGVVACGYCMNWRLIYGENLGRVLRLTREEIIERGWKPLDPVPYSEGPIPHEYEAIVQKIIESNRAPF